LQGRPFETAGTVAARLLHAPPPLASRGFTRRRSQRSETGGSGLLSSSFPLPTGCEERHHLQKQHNRNEQFVLVLFSPS